MVEFEPLPPHEPNFESFTPKVWGIYDGVYDAEQAFIIVKGGHEDTYLLIEDDPHQGIRSDNKHYTAVQLQEMFNISL